ncbi:MAG TPA: class I fructose-bisphosphate aldolase [Candidatus Paceibacterota bacterium]|nr:class I fructose-bisphosphate aldolase [Candidatus Paceibacterota bacterium]
MIDLASCAHLLVHPGKGLLAADESIASADKRLASFGIEPSEEMRRQYRDLFLATPGIEDYLSGVILYEETLEQEANDGTSFPALLAERGIIPGIKVDQGLEPFADGSEEQITKGLLGLPERLAKFHDLYGTGFTKWRATVRIDGDRLPTKPALVENMKRLASYAYEVQKTGMVPIVEPEVLLEGTHNRLRSRAVLEETLRTLVRALEEQAVDPSGVILKTAMAIAGKDSGRRDTPEEVAEDTIGALMATMPKDMPGIVFLSGGQTPDQATDNLRAIARAAKEKGAPWPLTFSYARALQEEALAVWAGTDDNLEAARALYIERLKKVYLAARGE